MENWEASLSSFHKRMREIEVDAKDVLDKCIPALKLSEQGIVFMNNIDNMNVREALATHLLGKFGNVLEKFVVEIESAKTTFTVSIFRKRLC